MEESVRFRTNSDAGLGGLHGKDGEIENLRMVDAENDDGLESVR